MSRAGWASALRTSPATTSGRTGPAPVATASSSARCEKEVSTCTRNRRAVRAAKRFCSRTTSGSSTPARPRTVDSLCTWAAAASSDKAISGCCLCLARGSLPRSWKRGSCESQGQFSPDGRWVAFMSTKSGTTPGLRDTHFLGATPSSRCRRLAEAGRAGTAMAKNCSTWRSTTR